MKKMILLAVCLMSLTFNIVSSTPPGEEQKPHVTPEVIERYRQDKKILMEYITEVHGVINMIALIYSVNMVFHGIELFFVLKEKYDKRCALVRRLRRLKLKKELDAKRANEQSGDSPSGVLPDPGNIEQTTN